MRVKWQPTDTCDGIEMAGSGEPQLYISLNWGAISVDPSESPSVVGVLAPVEPPEGKRTYRCGFLFAAIRKNRSAGGGAMA